MAMVSGPAMIMSAAAAAAAHICRPAGLAAGIFAHVSAKSMTSPHACTSMPPATIAARRRRLLVQMAERQAEEELRSLAAELDDVTEEDFDGWVANRMSCTQVVTNVCMLPIHGKYHLNHAGGCSVLIAI
eukprot:6214347-Pleurochrysis_carterae.AAC.3